jgi:hypothetical protein
MTPQEFNTRADAIQTQLEIFRLRIWAGLGTVIALSALAGSLMLAATEMNDHYKREALINQEQVVWK